jgi:hypothetical protein
MHRFIVTWRARVDLEMIGHRGASGQLHQTCPIVKVGLWTFTGVNQTLAGSALGHEEVRLVSILRKLGIGDQTPCGSIRSWTIVSNRLLSGV